MKPWQSAQEELATLLRNGNQTGASIPERIEELATRQLGAPIETPHDCAIAIELGLTCVGVGLEEVCPGRALVRAALKFLEAA